jgi:hypothetical protein
MRKPNQNRRKKDQFRRPSQESLPKDNPVLEKLLIETVENLKANSGFEEGALEAMASQLGIALLTASRSEFSPEKTIFYRQGKAIKNIRSQLKPEFLKIIATKKIIGLSPGGPRPQQPDLCQKCPFGDKK